MSDKVSVSALNCIKLIAEFLHLIFADIGYTRRNRAVDLICRARFGGSHKRYFFAVTVSV